MGAPTTTTLAFGIALAAATTAAAPADARLNGCGGIKFNGKTLNGRTLNGKLLNDAEPAGTGDAAGTGALRVTAARLPDGRAFAIRSR